MGLLIGAAQVISAPAAGREERWNGTIDLHQGDTGTIEITRVDAAVRGRILIKKGRTLIETPIEGEWTQHGIMFKRALSDRSVQSFKGVVNVVDARHVKMDGTFTAGTSGRWTCDCTLVESPATLAEMRHGGPPPAVRDTPATPERIGTHPANGVAVQSGKSLRPVVIQAGKIRRISDLRASSPYFANQLVGTWAPPLTLIEIDNWNSAYGYFHNQENKGNEPVGVDQKTVTFGAAQNDFEVNFRYSSGDAGAVGMLWQISRFPFANDPANWSRVPGLVGTGRVTDEHTDSDGYRYFRINFARVASHPLGAPPYVQGVVPIDRDRGVKAMGQVAVPPKAGPGAEARQGQHVVAIDRTPAAMKVVRLTPPAEVEQDQTFYVRVVPLHSGNAAGIPAIPVEVTVRRPRPCPASTSELIVRPPSARIVWYMQPNFFDNSDPQGRWYVVHGDQFYQQGAHMKDPPPKKEDKAWYEKVIDVFNSIISYFSNMMTTMSGAYDTLQNMYVEAHAQQWSYLTNGGLFKCDKHDWCKAMVKAGLHKTMEMAGVPPTLPTGPELLTLSKDYLVELGAETFGLEDLYDGYQELPPEAKAAFKREGRKITDEFTKAQDDARKAMLDDHLCYDVPDPLSNAIPKKTKKYCTPRIPDPIFNSAHPATVLVYVENTNSAPTQRILLSVTDSMGLFKPGSIVIPELRSGQGLSVPVILTEDTTQFMDYNGGKCPSKDIVTISGDLSCPMQMWRDKFWQTGGFWKAPKAPDTFRVTFSTGSGAAALSGIDAQSAGRPLPFLVVFEDGAPGGACTVSRVVKFPSGWQTATPTRSVVPDSWDNLFTGPAGQEGNPDNGMLRKR
jgi:hypothetical protein